MKNHICEDFRIFYFRNGVDDYLFVIFGKILRLDNLGHLLKNKVTSTKRGGVVNVFPPLIEKLKVEKDW